MLKSIKTSVIAAILISTAVIVHAQKKIDEGTLTYSMTYDLKPDQKDLAEQLPKELKLKFSGNLTKVEMDQYGAHITVLSDGVDKTGLVLVDIPVMQKQYAVKTTKEQHDQTVGASPKLTDFKATGEKQKIGLYNAEKYTFKDEAGATGELWATTDIQLPTGIIGEEFRTVKGTPVKFSRTQNGVKAILTITDVKEDKVGPLTLAVPSSYEVTTMEALRALNGG